MVTRPLGARDCEAGIALVAAVYSAIKRLPVQAGLVILGDLSIQGTIKPMRSLAEPLQVAMDSGARKALIPLENKRNFLEFAVTSWRGLTPCSFPIR